MATILQSKGDPGSGVLSPTPWSYRRGNGGHVLPWPWRGRTALRVGVVPGLQAGFAQDRTPSRRLGCAQPPQDPGFQGPPSHLGNRGLLWGTSRPGRARGRSCSPLRFHLLRPLRHQRCTKVAWATGYRAVSSGLRGPREQPRTAPAPLGASVSSSEKWTQGSGCVGRGKTQAPMGVLHAAGSGELASNSLGPRNSLPLHP